MPHIKRYALRTNKAALIRQGMAVSLIEHLSRLDETLRAVGFSIHIAPIKTYPARRCVVCGEYFIPHDTQKRTCSPEHSKKLVQNYHKYRGKK